ncbi:HEAT repeat domain-containing protein [Polyangium mundeleinium]|uniref:HEAT repeat domain-containing protein n=1 Tax=Polyangium mundeleinium TaxID=2995306 RepID=A0ABT5EVK5_9BACT|nr:hypothetical protein [Polyangium mundeleinium]MDC0744820.1 hypothetical protein [Polyangium mundeleinium]
MTESTLAMMDFCRGLLSRGESGLALVRAVVRDSSYKARLRACAARVLSPHLEPADVENACSLLLSGKPITRYMAAVALCRTASPASVDALIEALDDDELIADMYWGLYVSDVAALALTRIGGAGQPALAAWGERRRQDLHNPSYRLVAACALARVGDAQGRAVLEELVATQNDYMASDVLEALRDGRETYL